MNNPEPIAKKAIDEAAEERAVLITCIDGYQSAEEALYLRNMLWYAREKGVVVHFVPTDQKEK